MSNSFRVGDTILVSTNNDETQDDLSDEDICIGIIKYIGYVYGHCMSDYVGIELVESIKDGHNGTINGYQYFVCSPGHGIHTKITNVIRKLQASEVTLKMQQIITLFKSRLNQYTQALSERDAYIEKLKNKQRHLRNLLKESEALPRSTAIQMKPSEESTDTVDTMPTESSSLLPTFSSTSDGIILFSPQKESNKSSQTKPKTKNIKSTNPSTPIEPVTSVTPSSLSPRSRAPSSQTSNATPSKSIILHNMTSKRCTLPTNTLKLSSDTKSDIFPDTQPILSYDSSKYNTKSISSQTTISDTDTKYVKNGKYTEGDCTSIPSEWSDPEQYNNEYEAEEEEEDVDNNIYSPLSKDESTVNSQNNKSQKVFNTKPTSNSSTKSIKDMYTTNQCTATATNSPQNKAINTTNVPLYKSISRDIGYVASQQIQYTQKQYKQTRKYTQNMVPSPYLPQQTATNHVIVPLLTTTKSYPSPTRSPNVTKTHNKFENPVPVLHHNTGSKSANPAQFRYGIIQNGSSKQPQIIPQKQQQYVYPMQYVVTHNNAYYVQPQIEHWMQHQRRNQTYSTSTATK